MTLFIVFTQEQDGGFSAMVPSLPGCFSEGDTLEEAQKNIQEAIELYLENEEIDDELLSAKQIFTSIDLPLKK